MGSRVVAAVENVNSSDAMLILGGFHRPRTLLVFVSHVIDPSADGKAPHLPSIERLQQVGRSSPPSEQTRAHKRTVTVSEPDVTAYHLSMAKLLIPREQVEKMLGERIRAGQDLGAKAEVAKRTAGYRDWLHLFATWRDDTIAELKAAYEGKDIAQEFSFTTETSEHSSPQFTFEYREPALRWGIQKLETLIERLQLALPHSQDVAGIESLHLEIYSRCRTLYTGGDYAEAVEKGFKIVRDRLRSLTGYETGSEAFGKGKLYIRGAAAPHVDDDFQDGVKFLTMAIDRFRNEKSHTADGKISDPIRAYEYLRLSSLAMHLLDAGLIR